MSHPRKSLPKKYANKQLTINCCHIEGEILASELLPNRTHVTQNTKIPQINRRADLLKKKKIEARVIRENFQLKWKLC